MRVFAFLIPSILLMYATETAQAQDTRDKKGIIVQGGIVGGKSKRGIIVQGGKTKKKKPTGT